MKNKALKIVTTIFVTGLLSGVLSACSLEDNLTFLMLRNKEGEWGEDYYYEDDWDDWDYDDEGWDDDDDDYYGSNSNNNNGGGTNNGGQASSSNNGGSASQTGDTVDGDNPYFDFTWNSSDHTASICFKSGMENPNPVVPITYVYNGENYRIIDDDKAPGFSYMMIVETITIQEGFEKIQNGFCHDMNLISVKLPSALKKIHAAPFVNCSKLQKVEYNGTMAQWEAIQKDSGDDYNYGLPQDITIVCKDGNLTLPKDPDW